jgi:hypothetical protein
MIVAANEVPNRSEKPLGHLLVRWLSHVDLQQIYYPASIAGNALQRHGRTHYA